MPAAFGVMNLNDTGAGSLRQAIHDANNSGDASSTITFNASLSGTINLGSVLDTLSKNITITGPNFNNVVVRRDSSANTDFAIFKVGLGKICTINDLTISYGTDSGIQNRGSLSLCACTVSHCSTLATGGNGPSGGGIYSIGTLGLSSCTIDQNSTASGGAGGGIYNFGGTVTCDSSTITGNSATYGGGIDNYSSMSSTAQLTLTSTDITGNEASSQGGGIYNKGTLSMTGGSLSSNDTTTLDGGGLYNQSGDGTFSGVSITNNTSANNGGGFELFDGTLTFQNACTLSGNSASAAGPGGAVSAGATWSKTNDCTFSDMVVNL